MTFLETRGMLAKLLATENLIIEHDASVHTASFDTQNRVLRLPVLKAANEHVYNMFCAHEVGHALQTPALWKDQIPAGVPFDYVNVIEDVRIERYIQDKFPGLRRDFTKGYDSLNEQNFFQINGTDFNKLSLIDRINLHFKLGARAVIPFTQEEMTYVRAVDEADTWQKVILVSQMINDYIGNLNKNDAPETPQASENKSGGSEGDQTSGSNSEQRDDEQDDGDNKEQGEQQREIDETKSQTQEAFDNAMDKLAKGGIQNDVRYVNYKSVDLSDIIIDVKTLRNSFVCSNGDEYHPAHDNVKNRLKEFMVSIKSDVNHMVQQFEMKKSADAYARVQVNKTGMLDTNLLHSYQLTDDIFLRQNITPDGKNHGMVMYVDWSGSMSENVVAVAKQIIILVQFCRKVQIPFEVYTFTTGSHEVDENHEAGVINNNVTQLVQILSSQVKNKELDQDILNFFTSAVGISGGSYALSYSPYMCMGGTPLNNALMLVPDIIDQFKNKTNAQKVSFVCLTDGESSPLQFTEQRKSYDGKPYVATTYAYYEKIMIRDGHKVFPILQDDRGTTSIVKWLKSKLNDVSITHLFLAGMSGSARYVRGITNYNTILDEKVFRKNGCAHVTTDSWPMIGLINPKSFTDADSEITVSDGANKTQIKNALKKYLKSKSSSRLVLNQLVSNFS